MKTILRLSLLVLLCVSCASGNKGKSDKELIEITGTVQEMGMTTYMYGTHIIEGVAISSSVVELEDYLGQVVTVKGHYKEGYPLSGGPEYLIVTEISK